MLLHILACLVTVRSVFGALIVDTTAGLSVDQWKCLNQQGTIMMLGRLYESSGDFDQVGIQNLYNAFKAGNYQGIDSLISPCVSGNCTNGIIGAKEQADTILEKLTGGITEFHAFPWISVSRADGWSSDKEANTKFLVDMTEVFYINIGTYGIITSYNDWNAIIGPNFPLIAKKCPYLNYINWNGKADLTSGYSQFGGWTVPYAHQYAGNIVSNNCTNGASINYGYYDPDTVKSRRQAMKKDRRYSRKN